MDASTFVGGVYAISSATGSQTINSSTATDVTNLAINDVRVGKRPIRLVLVPYSYNGTNTSNVTVTSPALSSVSVFVELLREGSIIGVLRFDLSAGSVSGVASSMAPGAIEFYDNPGAGTYDYKIRARNLTNAAGEQIIFNYVRLLIHSI